MVNRRGGMGLLQYQAIPSLLVVDHDGVLCTYSNRSAQKRVMWSVKITPCWVTPLLPAGWPPCWANTLAFRVLGLIPTPY
jgi:hypothetical protein